MAALPEYRIYAIRYATREARRAEHFIGGDAHDGPMAMDYFVWAMVGAERQFVVDLGFSAAMGQKRQRQFLRCPAESLSLIGMDAASVSDVILTHLHYDHVGNADKFPKARFHLQDREMSYATGRHMRYPVFAGGFEAEDVAGMVRLNFGGRVEFHDGDAELAPGVSVHHMGGHTAGLQVVRVHTRRGWMVLASDASHYYEHIRRNRLFTIAYRLDDMIQAYRKIERLAASPDHVVPGHDPLVMALYPPAKPELQGIVARLDLDPKPMPGTI
ncbi:MAG: N-acyl homoserine lactonase family protein [Alphaproteobacteria bacterium]|nr:N-acyl homoserine lactonase family protein [Alphaproteobacteria bacterium]